METKNHWETTNKIKDLMANEYESYEMRMAANERHERKTTRRQRNPLKDIPNVVYVGKGKPADLEILTSNTFGRKGKNTFYMPHFVLVFIGEVIVEFFELKEFALLLEGAIKRLFFSLIDMMVELVIYRRLISRNNLLQFSGFCLYESEEEVIVKLLDFMEAPSARTDIINAEEQLSKSRKRKRDTKSNASKTSKGSPAENSMKWKKTLKNGMPDEDDATK
ncbi:hypothetical protein HPP92_028359 [Vanilla planifolia]|uniref:Uncharacterized protein n=1 Tax=Vanilla planifolia TaxID=51239 RepID=A0A835P8E4_VANPL|nr:hypothetical protein HPP92_028359 [Vanilla planifolia]